MILNGWELERLLYLEMWGDSLDPGQEFQLHGWIRKAVSLTNCVEESCTVLMWELRETSGSTQVTRIIVRQDNEIVKSKRKSRYGEELGREIKNLLSKHIVLVLAVENPKLDTRKTGQIWDRESHFWVIYPDLPFCPFIQPRQIFICRNISGEYDADRKCRGMPYKRPGGNIKQFPGD